MQKHEKEVEKSLQDLVAAQEVARKELLARLEAEKQGIEGEFEAARLRLEGEMSAVALGELWRERGQRLEGNVIRRDAIESRDQIILASRYPSLL